MPKIMYVPQHKQRLNQVKKERNLEVEYKGGFEGMLVQSLEAL